MRNRRLSLLGMVLLGFACLGARCADGARSGFQGGLDAAISAFVEAIITNALAPVTPTE